MNVDDLISRLDGVKKRHGYYVSRCPAHEDRHASLSVKEGDDGRVLLNCHAGCTFENIIGALRLEAKDLSGKEIVTGEPEQVYVYTDAGGKPLYEVCRFPGKKFRQRQVNGEWGLKGVDPVPYRLPEVIATAQLGGIVCVCEGEKDVEALRSVGRTATCNSGGAGKWRPEFGEYLRGATAVIVVDKDEPGRKHAEQVRESLVGKARAIYLVQAKRGKDAADHIAAGFTPEQFVPLKDRRMSGITTSSEMADKAIAALEARRETVPVYPNPWGTPEPEFARGRLYVISGWTGSGKSAIATQIFRHLASAGVRVGYITNEMTETDLRNRLLCHRGFRLKELEKPWNMSEENQSYLRKVADEFRSWNSDIVFDTQANYEKVADYMDYGGYDFLIFDHLHRIESSTAGEEAAIAREVRGFTNLALNYDIPVFLVVQLRRPPHGVTLPKPTIHDFKGSSAIEQEAAMAMAIWRDGSQAELSFLKNRHGASGNTELLTFQGERFSFTKGAVGGANVW